MELSLRCWAYSFDPSAWCPMSSWADPPWDIHYMCDGLKRMVDARMAKCTSPPHWGSRVSVEFSSLLQEADYKGPNYCFMLLSGCGGNFSITLSTSQSKELLQASVWTKLPS